MARKFTIALSSLLGPEPGTLYLWVGTRKGAVELILGGSGGVTMIPTPPQGKKEIELIIVIN